MPNGAKGGDRKSFPFHASNFPCTTTHPDDDPDDPGGEPLIPKYPVPLTPHLDHLATFGAVFPRAYVTGNACKSSRSVLLFGKTHRHLTEGDIGQGFPGPYSIASWLNKEKGHTNEVQPDPATADMHYWPLMLGKGEVLGETGGGFQGGLEKSKPKLAKYDCKDGTTELENCREAAEPNPSTHVPSRTIPWEARVPTKGIEDVPDLIEGAGDVRPRFLPDKEIWVWHDLDPENAPDCSACGDASPPAHCKAGGSVECVPQLKTPFFLWYAPNQPHKRGQGHAFRELYDEDLDGDTKLNDVESGRVKHAARITQFDQGLGATIDELKRMCICGAKYDDDGTLKDPLEAQKQSLFEHTVVIVISDHGFFLPEAKRNAHENTHRTPVIVSEPHHRRMKSTGGPILTALQFPNDIAHAIDVFRTVLDYAGVPYEAGDGDPIDPDDDDGNDDYVFGRSLKAWVQGARTDPVRDVAYSEEASQGEMNTRAVRGPLRRRYLVTRPGIVGVCRDPETGDTIDTDDIVYDPVTEDEKPHARPCLLDPGTPSNHDCGQDYECVALGRCINDPARACDPENGNEDCVDETFCSATGGGSGRCVYKWDGSLGDMARPVEPDPTDDAVDGVTPSATCTNATVATDCVPAGVQLCQGIILKVEARPPDEEVNKEVDGEISRAWDLLWDPDQRHDLLATGDYLGTGANSLKAKFDECLDNYWKIETDDQSAYFSEWAGSRTGCFWEEPALPSS